MTREEQIIKASHLYAKAQQKPFIDGALWADEHPSPTWIDKACEWLNTNYAEIYLLARAGVNSDKVVEKFKKAMEEQQ